MEFRGLISSCLARLEMLITISSLILRVLWLFTVHKLFALTVFLVFGVFKNSCLYAPSVVFVNLSKGPKGKFNYHLRDSVQSLCE